jgi:hypothetical protein
MRAGLLGWVFAVSLGLLVYVSAYFNRVSISAKDGSEDHRSTRARTVALIVLVGSSLVDGVFNLLEVWRTADTSTPWLQAGALLYGITPTLGIAAAAWLQGQVHRIPTPPHKPGLVQALNKLFLKRIEDATTTPSLPTSIEVEILEPVQPRFKYTCNLCAEGSNNRNWCGPHTRWCKKKGSGKIEFVIAEDL